VEGKSALSSFVARYNLVAQFVGLGLQDFSSILIYLFGVYPVDSCQDVCLFSSLCFASSSEKPEQLSRLILLQAFMLSPVLSPVVERSKGVQKRGAGLRQAVGGILVLLDNSRLL
jgi:hypothetical protein